MAEFPITLDTLIQFVDAVHPDGDALAHLTDAVTVGRRVQDRADALIGHYVDQARHSGASWSQIGESMGVSKQAVQQRFVGRANLTPEERVLRRLPPRARRVLAAARALAVATTATGEVEPRHIVAAMPSEPESIAAQAIHALGVEDAALAREMGVGAVPDPVDPSDGSLAGASFGASAKRMVAHALDISLHYGHNYIGTEHLLLSAASEGPAAEPLRVLGLSDDALKPVVEELLAAYRPSTS